MVITIDMIWNVQFSSVAYNGCSRIPKNTSNLMKILCLHNFSPVINSCDPVFVGLYPKK